MGGKRKMSWGANLNGRLSRQQNEQSDGMMLNNVPSEDIDHHFRELYANPPDFKALARLDPDFAAVTKGRELDFNDPASVMQLTKTLLKLDFALNFELPEDRLCPPVINRHNYILWLKSLLDTTSYDPSGRKAVGLDIGTGASCIYPLLGCSQRPWSFIATDIDEKSLECARKNVKSNNLDHRITILSRKPSDSLIPLDSPNIASIDFTMTNPPFYSSTVDLIQSASQKSRPPFTACTGSDTEMVTPGGEVTFVKRIVQESLVSKEKIQWYTAMLGFLSSVTPIVEMLKEEGISNLAISEFVQGNRTRRWVVGWSFGAMRPTNAIARGTKAISSKALLPPMTEHEAISMPLPKNVGGFAEDLSTTVKRLDLISWEWHRERLEGVGRASGNVWNRAWRRKKKMREMKAQDGEKQGSEETAQSAFGFKVWIRVTKNFMSVGCRWLEGQDEMAFESFVGYLKTTVESIRKANEISVA